MVQVINTGNPHSKIAEMLGLSLGQGLSTGINNFYANRALDDVLNDKSLANAPASEKIGKLQQALSPYGEQGQQIFNQRMQIEIQAQQERQAKEVAKLDKEKEERLFKHQKELEGLKATNQSLLEDKKQTGKESLEGIKFGQKQNLEENKSYRESQIREGEQGRLFEHQKGLQGQKDEAAGSRQGALFGHQTGLQTQKDTAAGNRQGQLFGHQTGLQTQKDIAALERAKLHPIGGLGGQPVPPDQVEKMESVIENNPNASADQLALAMAKAGVNPAYFKDYIENRRHSEEIGSKTTREDKKILRDEELQFHKESEKYDEDLLKQGKIAKQQQETIKGIEKALSSGNVKPSSMANVFKGLGKIGDKISEALINGDQAALQASIPQLLEGWKDIFGVRLTDADLKLLQDKLPSIGKSPEANRAILNVLRKYAEVSSLRSKIGEQIKDENKGLRPLGYANKIEKRYDEMTKPVKIIRPAQNGRPEREIEIPAYKLSEAIQGGARLANEL